MAGNRIAGSKDYAVKPFLTEALGARRNVLFRGDSCIERESGLEGIPV